MVKTKIAMIDKLAPSEREIALMVSQRMTAKAIAGRNSVSVGTVRMQIARIRHMLEYNGPYDVEENKMAETKIAWADYSWNPWYGCHKVSQGCKNCYMFREQKMYGRDPEVVVKGKTTFDWPLKWMKQVRAGNAKPGRVFTCSWSDWFIQEADMIRDEAWEIIRQTPEMTYMILTKRPERIAECLPGDWGDGWPNVWLGVSCEDQENAARRVPLLLDIDARVKFVSAEPLLQEVELFYWLGNRSWRHGVDWVIAGGESGPNARPMAADWVCSLRDQCQLAGVPFFFKQWGGKLPGGDRLLEGREWSEFPGGE